MKKLLLFITLCMIPSLWQTVSAQCNLVCNDHLNASMPADDCYRTFEYDDFLENPSFGCEYDNLYEISLAYPFGTEILNGADVNRSHIGYTLVYSVYELDAAGERINSCWGYVTVEDKAGPQPTCKSRTVSCFQVALINQDLTKIVDNCGEPGYSKVETLKYEDWGCAGTAGVGQVTRTIRTWDTWNNSATCKDTLIIRRDSLKNVVCPELVPLACDIACDLNGDGDKTDPGEFGINSTVGHAAYPTPELLLKYQAKGCIPADTLIVPQIWDSVDMAGVLVRKLIPIYPALGGFCKVTVAYWDKLIPICTGGSGFKIRREWVISDWCLGKDTICVQYIKVEDTKAPVVSRASKTLYTGVTDAHTCLAPITLLPLTVTDCSPVDQSYIVEYADAGHPGKTVILSGTLSSAGSRILVPAVPASNLGVRCVLGTVYAVDKCLNRISHPIRICVSDITPPTPVCDEYTQTTVDPSTCWARIYAHDLDNGSRDNCCNTLHFAVATMAAVTKAEADFEAKITADCGSKEYWKNIEKYKFLRDQWINCNVFADYVDLSQCGDQQVILRVYEACGIPRYDPHVYPCSEHDWYCYNAYVLHRIWRNYQWLHPSGIKDCNLAQPWLCIDKYEEWLNLIDNSTNILFAAFEGASGFPADLTSFIRYTYEGVSKVCYAFNFPAAVEENIKAQLAAKSGDAVNTAPGNTCSSLLYNDCMVIVKVDDKAPPVCEEPVDKFWYCDNVGTSENTDLEYANTACDIDDSYDENPTVYASDYTCEFSSSRGPYGAIESVKEYDTDQTDAIDPTGKAYGWYGCSIYGPSHPGDEHGGTPDNCHSNTDVKQNNGSSSWAPVYCHTWLTLDRTDAAGKIDPKSAFDSPKTQKGNPNGASAGAGKFWLWDNCAVPTFTSVDGGSIDNCGNGWISRTWTGTDGCGNTVKCDQKIITRHRSDFEVTFPEDVVVNCVGGDLSPEALGRPMIMDDECELVGVSAPEDVRYDVVPDACYKIVRTWKIIDWCKYDANLHNRYPEVIVDDRLVADRTNRYCVYRNLKDDGDGYMTYTQIIKVIDTERPKITSCKDTTFCITTGTDADCTVPTFSSVPFKGTDVCADDVLSFRWELVNASTNALISKSGANQTRFTSTNLTAGTHRVRVIAEDNCSNEDTCYFNIVVKDCKKPTPYCYNGLATVIMPSSGSVTLWASDLNAGSFDNCTAKSGLTYSFGPDKTKTSRVFTCAADLANGVSATIFVDIYVWDAAGNSDYCTTYVQLQDNPGGACPDVAGAAGAIAGKIATETTEPVENVILEGKSSSAIPSFKTDNKGSYSFNGLAMKSDYTITPKRDDDPTNGVSTIDLVLIQKHILGVQSLNSAYKVIAADVDKSNDVTAVDLVELRKLILTVYDKLPNNTSWRFAPKTYTFASITNPWGFPEKIDIKGLTQDELARDFVGIKIGDVNGTVVPHSLLGAESRDNGSSLRFRAEDRQLKVGEETVIEFTAENFRNIEGYQFSMALKGLELKGVNSGLLKITENNFGTTKISEGYITTSWNESKGITANSTDVLFSIKVKATKATSLSESLVINSKYTRAEAFDGKEAIGVSLAIGQKANAGYALHQNTPNPFKATTVISYELAKSDKVNLKVTDVTGKVIRVYTQDGLKGFNQLRVNRNEVGGAGVLYYTIETKDYSATKKMILVD